VSKRAIVCDTTVLLYLGRIGQIDLLPALFSPVYVPEPVMLELDMGRLLRLDTINSRGLAWVTPVSVSQAMIDDLPTNRLGAGERAVIAFARAQDDCMVGLDDLRARQLAEAVGLKVVGTLGTLLHAKKADLISTVQPLIDDVIAQGFRLSPDLYRDVLELAGEGSQLSGKEQGAG
jgi:predicted nucleic acid-binding protein